MKKSIADDTARLAAIDRLISKMYEDMIADRINTENFNSLMEKSQAEQSTLKNRVKLNMARLDGQERKREDESRWIMLIREYADIQELDAATLNQLIKKIVTHIGMYNGAGLNQPARNRLKPMNRHL